MIADKKRFSAGLVMMIAFSAVLVAMFMPLIGGKNGLQYLDDLYNSISKGSAHYIPKVRQTVEKLAGQQIEVSLTLKKTEQAEQTAKLFNAGGALVNVSGTTLKVAGDLGRILNNCLDDAQMMYANDGAGLKAKYGYEERRVLYNWWLAGNALEEALNNQKQFKFAKAVHDANAKAVETAYNYYGIKAQKISERFGVVVFSLAFYVIYTLWYGFGIMFMFEGWGMRLEH